MTDLSGITYDEATGRYRDTATGRYVSRADVRAALDRVLASSDSRVRTIGESLRTGQLSLADFEAAMRVEIKLAHLEATLAARGGQAFMTPAIYGRVGQLIKVQYAYLNAFAKDIANGLPLDGRFIARTTLYDSAAHSTYEAAIHDEMEQRGMAFERNVLAPADHCPGCLEETARGWVPIGELVPPGERDCMVRCRCSVAYAADIAA